MNKIIAKQMVDSALGAGMTDELSEIIAVFYQLKKRNSDQGSDNLFRRYRLTPLNQLITTALEVLSQSGNRLAKAALKITQTPVKIEKIMDEVERVWRQKVEYAELESAKALTTDKLTDLTVSLKKITSRPIIIHQKVNSALIGGLILRFRGLTYRFDLNSQIMALKHG